MPRRARGRARRQRAFQRAASRLTRAELTRERSRPPAAGSNGQPARVAPADPSRGKSQQRLEPAVEVSLLNSNVSWWDIGDGYGVLELDEAAR
jgi:hypothetical protein